MKKIYLLNLLLILILFSSCINKYGNIEIITVPDGALIYLDGINTGKKTPSSLNKISFGKHIITLKLFGYKDEEIVVELSSLNKKISINKILTQMTSTIEIDSEPEYARILLDGDDINKLTPSVIENIPYGYHKISLYKTPYIPFEEEIYVDSDNKIFKFNLQKIKFKEIEKSFENSYFPIIDGDYLYSIDNDFLLKKINLINYEVIKEWNLKKILKVNNLISVIPVKIYDNYIYFKYWILKNVTLSKGSDLKTGNRIPISYLAYLDLKNEKIVWEKPIIVINENSLDSEEEFLSIMNLEEEGLYTFTSIEDKFAFIGQLELMSNETQKENNSYIRHFLILDRLTGKILKMIDDNYSLFCCDPFYYENKIYIRTVDKLICYDLNNFQKLSEIKFPFGKTSGISILGDEEIIVCKDVNFSKFIVLDRNSGETLWNSSPISYDPFLYENYIYYVEENSNSTYNRFFLNCVDKKNGNKIWSLQFLDVNNSLRILGVNEDFIFTKQTIYYPKQKSQILYYILYNRNTKKPLWYYSLPSTEYIYEEAIFKKDKIFLISPSQGFIIIFNLN